MKNIIYIAVLLVVLSACNPSTMPFKIAPRNVTSGPLDHRPKFDGPEAQVLSIAYDHGCESGIASYGNYLLKSQYKYIRDKELSANGSYSRMWSDSYSYCRHWMSRHQSYGLYADNSNPGAEDKGVANSGILTNFSTRAEPTRSSPMKRFLPQTGAINFFGYSPNEDRGFFNPPTDTMLKPQAGNFFDQGTGNFLSHSSDAWPW